MIPKPEDFIFNYDDEYFQGEVYGDFAYPRKEVIKALKEYGLLVRDETLKWAAENVRLTSFANTDEGTTALKFKNGEDYIVMIDKNIILNGKESDNLKI